MVMSLFRDVPDDEYELPEEGTEDEESTDSEDEDADAAANKDSDEATDDEGDDDGPVSKAKYDADMAAMNRVVQELRTAVGRAQGLARQVERSTGPDIQAQLREQNLAVAELFGTLVEGIDESALDPQLRKRVLTARQEILEAENRAKMLDELKKELGFTPEVQAEREELETLQERANVLAETIEDQIVAAGLDPNDETLFPWAQWAAKFRETKDERGVRRDALAAIAAAKAQSSSEDRRESKRGAAGRTPRGKSGAAPKDPILNGSLQERIDWIQKNLR